MSGVYNHWIKVLEPGLPNDIVQMRSNGEQVPFYFGASTVPHVLGISGSGFNTQHTISTIMPKINQGIKKQKTYVEKHSKIILPRYMKSITK